MKFSVARVLGTGLLLVGTLMVSTTSELFGQSLLTANTLQLDDPTQRPSASINDLAWLAGSWEGEAFGGTVEEMWTLPTAGTIVGVFKGVTDGSVMFYEIEWIAEEEGSLTLKLKHFHPDFTGWEEREEMVEFPLVRLTHDAVYFDGLTFRRVGQDGLVAYVALRQDGQVREEEIVYWRVEGN